MYFHLRHSPQQILIYSKQQTNKVQSAKFEKAGIVTSLLDLVTRVTYYAVQNLERRKATSLLDQYTVKLQLSQRVHRSLNLDRMTGQKVMKRKTIISNTYIHNCLVAKRIFTSYLLKRRPHIEMDEQRLQLFEG